MNAEWFKNEIKNWSPKLNWTNNEIVEMSKLLLEISKLNGGEIVWDCEKDLQIEKEYAIEKARNAIQSKMTLYTIFFLKHHFKFYSKKGKNIHLQPDFLVLHRFYPMLNLNFASSRELEKLPGIGKVTALRIIKMREKIGKFTNEEEILNVKGIRKYNFNKFKDKIYLSSDPPLKKILHTDIEAFLEEPNFTNYIVLLLKGICIDPYQNKFEFISVNPKKLVFLELQDILDQLKSDEKTKRKSIRKRGSRVFKEFNERKRALNIIKTLSTGPGYGTIISDGSYPYFLHALLKGAKEKIRIIMFFLMYKNDKNYPTYQLVEELINAHKNGKDVRIILDKDREGDVYGSRNINKNVYNHLKSNNVPVIFETPERLTHIKLILVDDEHVVIGSHNWTAGSFYQYDDKSIYIKSNTLSSYYYKRFNELWELSKNLK